LSELLSNYVLENAAKAERRDLLFWMASNEAPYTCDCRYGGMRVFLFKSGENIVLAGRNGNIYTPLANPRVFSDATEFVRAPYRMILDGEYLPGDGIHIFDVLQVDDRNIRILPLRERKKIVDQVIQGTNLETRSQECRNQGEIIAFRDLCVSSGGQGVVVKNNRSRYGEPGAWLELDRPDTICCFVSDIGPSDRPFSCTIGLVDSNNGKLLDLGTVTSLSEKVKRSRITFGSVVEVKFQGISTGLKLKDPFIVKVRTDMAPSECDASQIEIALNLLY
jgi:ATP-dependent DNA ligase